MEHSPSHALSTLTPYLSQTGILFNTWCFCEVCSSVSTRTWKDDWNGLISRSSFWTLAFSPGYIAFPPVRKTFWTRIACCSFGYLQGTKELNLFQEQYSYKLNSYGENTDSLPSRFTLRNFLHFTSMRPCAHLVSTNSWGGRRKPLKSSEPYPHKSTTQQIWNSCLPENATSHVLTGWGVTFANVN